MRFPFTKMNGAGNDFVVCDNLLRTYQLERETIARICDRHRGVGADGLLAVEPGEAGADFRMRYYNSDGGEAEMCGNGARCFSRFAARLLEVPRDSISFETQAGTIRATFSGELVTIDMSDPHSCRVGESMELPGGKQVVHSINTGVPHAVVFVEAVETVDVQTLGAAIRWHEAFAPKGTNANFAQVVSPRSLVLRTYERGVEGETLACGTGVCASALLHHVVTGARSPISVKVRGGDVLSVAFERQPDGSFKNVALEGPADFVFDGVMDI